MGNISSRRHQDRLRHLLRGSVGVGEDSSQTSPYGCSTAGTCRTSIHAFPGTQKSLRSAQDPASLPSESVDWASGQPQTAVVRHFGTFQRIDHQSKKTGRPRCGAKSNAAATIGIDPNLNLVIFHTEYHKNHKIRELGNISSLRHQDRS